MFGNKPKLEELAKHHNARKPTWLTDAYEQHFSNFYPQTMLEIGVQSGNSVGMWKDYFPRVDYYGLDIHLPKDAEQLRARALFKGDQGDPHVLETVAGNIPSGIDLIVDDGSHQFEHQKLGVVKLWPYLSIGGYYAVEDIGTSYIPKRYGGGFRQPYTTMEWLKKLTDVLNCRWYHEPRLIKYLGGKDAVGQLNDFEMSLVGEIDFITFHEGLCIIKKRKHRREFLSDRDFELVTNTGPNKV